MKLSCNVYRDLMLMLEEDLGSEDSRRLVEEHLAECEDCRRFYVGMHLPEEMARAGRNPEEKEQAGRNPEEKEQAGRNPEEKEALRKSFRKIKRRWMLSLVLLLMLFPLSWLGRMAVNEIRGEGTCFSNLDEIYIAGRFLELMQEGDYEKAVEMIDFEEKYQELSEYLKEEQAKEYEACYKEVYGDVLGMTAEEFAEREKGEFLAYIGSRTGEKGIQISDYHYEGALFYPALGEWRIYYKIQEPTGISGYEERSWTFGMIFSKEGKIWESGSRYNPLMLEDLGRTDGSLPAQLEEKMGMVNEAVHAPFALQELFTFQRNRLSRLINGLE